MKYIFFITICLTIFVLYFVLNKKEQFTNNFNSINLKGNAKINNILPHKNENGNMEYIITVLSNNNKYNPNHLYNITNLKNIGPGLINNYTPIKNGMIDKNTVIVDINWHRDEINDGLSLGKRLMCVGLKNLNNVIEYTIYIKETPNIESKWIEYTVNNKKLEKRIKSIVYDLHDNLLGIDWKENQIYQLNETIEPPEWVGPISFDNNIKIHKILFNVEKKMIAIDTLGKIHIKNDINWRYSNWKVNKKVSKIKILDMIYDFDGKFIFLVDDNSNNEKSYILKQKNYDIFSFNFDNFFKIKEISNPVLSLTDIIMYKTGIDTEKYDYLSIEGKTKLSGSELKRKTVAMINLNHYLKLKRKLLLKCKNIRNQFSNTNFKLKSDIKTHMPLYQTIDELITKLEQKYE